MALDKSQLATALQQIAENPPATHAAAAAAGSDAIATYAGDVIPATTTAASGAALLLSAFLSAFQSPDASLGMESGVLAYGATVGLGMLPAYAAVAPVAPVGFAALFAGISGNAAAAAQNVADSIDIWIKTGTATLVAPPNTPVVWS